jgi:FlaA1/EpsC-like NDP-sugar epimerase
MVYLAGFTPDVDIPIQITGLRPGEKLHESLVCSTENVIPTEHPKILAVLGQLPSPEALSETITKLSEATNSDLPPKKLWTLANYYTAILEISNNLTVL